MKNIDLVATAQMLAISLGRPLKKAETQILHEAYFKHCLKEAIKNAQN